MFDDSKAELRRRTLGKAMQLGGTGNRAQLGLPTIIAAFILVVAGIAIVFVLDIFNNAIGTPSSSALSTSQDNMLSGFSSLADLVEPILVIAGVVIILGLIRRVQQ